jgi:hypothetical protein
MFKSVSVRKLTEAKQAEWIRLTRSNQDARFVRRAQMIPKQVIRRHPI